MTPFFWKKVFFGMGEKVVLLIVCFEKVCFPENTIFIVFQQSTAVALKRCMLKKQNN